MSQEPSSPSSGLAIGTSTARFALAPHPRVDLSALFAADGAPPGCIAEIVEGSDGTLAILNIGTRVWTVTQAGGPTRSVQPGEEIAAVAGTTILLGTAILGVGPYGSE